MSVLKGILGKIITGMVALAVIAAGISWFQMSPGDRASVMHNTGRIGGWMGIVLILPWATFFASRYATKFDSNIAGGLLVAAYSIFEIWLLLWLFDFDIRGGISWIFVTLGMLVCIAYNLLICDWIAERFE